MVVFFSYCYESNVIICENIFFCGGFDGFESEFNIFFKGNIIMIVFF